MMQRLARTSVQPQAVVSLAGLLQPSVPAAVPALSRLHMHTVPDQADWAICSITASSERASTVCVQGSHSITIDHPTYLGGHDSAPGPVAHFLGSLVGAQQASLHAVAAEQGVKLGKVTWQAQARIDARGVQGDSGVPAEFDSVRLVADIETDIKGDRLAAVRDAATHRCIVANTLRKAGVDLNVEFNKRTCFQEWTFKSSMGTHIP